MILSQCYSSSPIKNLEKFQKLFTLKNGIPPINIALSYGINGKSGGGGGYCLIEKSYRKKNIGQQGASNSSKMAAST